jgi:cysteine desulfurase
MPDRVYLDNSATTPVASAVLDAMLPYLGAECGNASSLHRYGREARRAVETSRESIADALGVRHDEIVFTSITSRIEHDAVLHAVKWLHSTGVAATFLDVDEAGRVDPDAVRAAMRRDTFLVSVMAGNNEIGTLEPIGDIGRMCSDRGILFHTDAVQALGKIDMDIDDVGLLAASAHKLHGPKGVGLLYVRRGTRLVPLFHGGGHERGLRSGTENVPGIVGFAAAVRLALAERREVTDAMRRMRRRLIDQVLRIPGTRLNGHPEHSLPHITNFSFAAIEGESLVMKLDEAGIAASTGSACSSPNLEPSHVLVAIGVPLSMAHGSLRISTGRETTDADIERLLDVLPGVVGELRAMSPFKVGE